MEAVNSINSWVGIHWMGLDEWKFESRSSKLMQAVKLKVFWRWVMLRHWDGTSSLLSHFLSWLSSIRQRSLQGTTGASTLPLWSSTCFDYHHEIWCPRHLKDKDSCQHYLLSASEKPAKVCCCRSLLVRRSFVLKVAPNSLQTMESEWKRYGELPKAIPCNIFFFQAFGVTY